MSPPSITHLSFSEDFGLVLKVNREVTLPLNNLVSASRHPSSLCCHRKLLHDLPQKGRILLRDEPVLFALPLRLQIEITVQIRSALAFDKQRKELGRLL